jgi:hypothetical protein
LAELIISDLKNLEPGRIFYSGKLYVVETVGGASKARPWGTPPGTLKDCVTLSRRSVLAQFHPVVERALVLPVLKRGDFLVKGQPTAYSFKTEQDARRASQLDCDLALRDGVSLQRSNRFAAWLLTDGANPHRLYHYPSSSAADAAYAAYCAKHNCVKCTWPDERTQYWPLLLG